MLRIGLSLVVMTLFAGLMGCGSSGNNNNAGVVPPPMVGGYGPYNYPMTCPPGTPPQQCYQYQNTSNVSYFGTLGGFNQSISNDIIKFYSNCSFFCGYNKNSGAITIIPQGTSATVMIDVGGNYNSSWHSRQGIIFTGTGPIVQSNGTLVIQIMSDRGMRFDVILQTATLDPSAISFTPVDVFTYLGGQTQPSHLASGSIRRTNSGYGFPY